MTIPLPWYLLNRLFARRAIRRTVIGVLLMTPGIVVPSLAMSQPSTAPLMERERLFEFELGAGGESTPLTLLSGDLTENGSQTKAFLIGVRWNANIPVKIRVRAMVLNLQDLFSYNSSTTERITSRFITRVTTAGVSGEMDKRLGRFASVSTTMGAGIAHSAWTSEWTFTRRPPDTNARNGSTSSKTGPLLTGSFGLRVWHVVLEQHVTYDFDGQSFVPLTIGVRF